MHRAAGTAAVLFFFFLATGSWISHTSRFDGVASTFSFSVPPPALSPSTLARTRSLFSSRFFHRPEEPPSIVLPSETSFCFTPHSLPPSLSLSVSLFLSTGLLYTRFLSFVHGHDCVRTGELRTWFARAGNEEKRETARGSMRIRSNGEEERTMEIKKAIQ